MFNLLFKLFGVFFAIEVCSKYIPGLKEVKHPSAKLLEWISGYMEEWSKEVKNAAAKMNQSEEKK